MNWFKKILPSRIKTEGNGRRTIPEGVWTKCDDCGAVLYREELDKNLEVCPKCNHHMKIGARIRLESFLDEELRKEIGSNIHTTDILKFRDIKRYKDRLSQAKKNTGEDEALIVISGNLTVNGNTVTHNVETLTVEDPIIGIRKNATNLGDGGFIIDRKGQNSSNTNRAFVWDESESYFTLIETDSLVDSITLDTSGARSNFRSNKIICDNTLSVHDSTILRSTLSVGNNLLIGTSNLFIDTQNNGDIGIGTSSPSANVHINHTGSLVIPVGTTENRQSVQGAIRYNNSLSQYEGYNGNNWGSLGGVIDVDQDTYISAENTPGIDNDELKFFTSGTQRILLDSSGSLSISNNVTISNNLDINNGYQKITNNNSVSQIITNRKSLGTAIGSGNSILLSSLFSLNINNSTYNSVIGNSGGLKLQLNISDSVNQTNKFEEYYIQFRYTYDSSDLEDIFPLRLLGFQSSSSNNITISDTTLSVGTKTGGGGSNNRVIPINLTMTPTYSGNNPTFYIYYTIIFTGSEGISILL